MTISSYCVFDCLFSFRERHVARPFRVFPPPGVNFTSQHFGQFPERPSGTVVLPDQNHRKTKGETNYLELKINSVIRQFPHVDFQHPRDEPEVENGDVSLTPLDGPDEGAVEPASLGEHRLGQAAGDPRLPDPIPQTFQKSSCVHIHRGRRRSAMS